jgi:hypothetical protein
VSLDVVKYGVLLNAAKIKILHKQHVRTTLKVKVQQTLFVSTKAIPTADAREWKKS